MLCLYFGQGSQKCKATIMSCYVSPSEKSSISKMSDTFQIRVVNAFRHGMDSQQLQQATSNPNIQRVLQKQASLSGKRFSVTGSSTASATAVQVTTEATAATVSGTLQPPGGGGNVAAASNTRITIPEQSFSHTETAV